MKIIIIAVLLTVTVGFWGCEKNTVEPQVNETDILLSKIQNASLDEIYQFFGTTNSKGLSIKKDASYLKLVFPNKSLNTDDLIVIVEDEYLDNIDEASRVIYLNVQTFDIVMVSIKFDEDNKEWSFFLTQDDSVDSQIDQKNGLIVLNLNTTELKNSSWDSWEDCFVAWLQSQEDAWNNAGILGKAVIVASKLTGAWHMAMVAAAIDCLLQS